MNFSETRVLLRVKSKREILEIRQTEIQTFEVLKFKEFFGFTFVQLKRSFTSVEDAQLFIFKLEGDYTTYRVKFRKTLNQISRFLLTGK